MELRNMVVLASRTGRNLQRYDSGRRQVVGCIPYRFKVMNGKKSNNIEEEVEVLVITPQRKGKGMLFPKGGWEADESIRDAALRETVEEAGVFGDLELILGKWSFNNNKNSSYDVYMFPLRVKEELDTWPEKDKRQRIWMSVPEAREACHYGWMKEALEVLVNRLASPDNNVMIVDQSCVSGDPNQGPHDHRPVACSQGTTEDIQHSSMPTCQCFNVWTAFGVEDSWKIQVLGYPMFSLIEMQKSLKQALRIFSWKCYLNIIEKDIQVSLDPYGNTESSSLILLKHKSLIDEDWDRTNFAYNLISLSANRWIGTSGDRPRSQSMMDKLLENFTQ